MMASKAALLAFVAFAGAFAAASIWHDLRAALAAYLQLMKGPTDDD